MQCNLRHRATTRPLVTAVPKDGSTPMRRELIRMMSKNPRPLAMGIEGHQGNVVRWCAITELRQRIRPCPASVTWSSPSSLSPKLNEHSIPITNGITEHFGLGDVLPTDLKHFYTFVFTFFRLVQNLKLGPRKFQLYPDNHCDRLHRRRLRCDRRRGRGFTEWSRFRE